MSQEKDTGTSMDQQLEASTPKDEQQFSEMKKSDLSFDSPIKQPSEEDYETIKLISNGAYGGVYLVRHKETRQKFAMKKIDKQSLILRNQVEQAFAERDIMSHTDNPFVVSLYCSLETKRYLCLVMEYVEGGDLATLLKNMGPLPVDLARFYFAETVLAVEYLHSIGIVHRDLKPENLLITALGHIKLTDFGLSKIGLMNLATNICEEHLNKRNEAKEFNDKQVCGTPEYIAPEVISRQGYGKPVDWWSMGIILYELLIGCVPFFGETPEELFAHVINDEITWPEEDEWPLPEDAKDIITKLLKRDPVERLGTGGSHEVKEHSFFESMNWDDLLRQKAEFVPQLDNDEDTSYFDTRLDRYNHEIDDSEEQDDTDESSSSMFSSFSSCSPKYHRVYSRIEQELAQEKLMKSASTASILDESVQTSSTLNDSYRGDLDVSVDNEPVDPTDPLKIDASGSPLAAVKSAPVPNESSVSLGVIEKSPLRQKISSPPNADKMVTHSTPDSSQTESEDFSPKVVRRRKPFNIELSSIPRFSISTETDLKFNEPKESIPQPTQCVSNSKEMEKIDNNKKDENDRKEDKESKDTKDNNDSKDNRENQDSRDSIPNSQKSQIPRSSHFPVQLNILRNRRHHHHHHHHQSKGRSVIKSASATGLSLAIPCEDGKATNNSNNLLSSGGSSTSSRDASPNREVINSLGQQLKPPIIIRRCPRGFGFTLRAIKVYYGDSDLYTVHHLVLAVEPNSPAFEAGLRPNALITHINSEPIQGLLHHQVLQLVLSGGDKINIRTTPLENTTIKTGGRRRNPSSGRMIRRPNLIGHKKAATIKRSDSDKRRRSSLLRKLNSKRASVEIQQLMAASGAVSPPLLAPSRSFQSLNVNRSTSIDVNPEISTIPSTSSLSPSSSRIPRYPKSSPPNRLHCSPSDSSAANSSQSSSPTSSAPNSPASLSHFPHFPRPSTLSGLKQHKAVKSLRSPRRKSCGHIPLSPLARTPSPSLQSNTTSSPTRTSSATVFPIVHPPGSSQTTQSFIIHKNKMTDSLSSAPSSTTTPTINSPTIGITSPGLSISKCGSRPKSAEPNSPFLRRALSPERLIRRNTDPKQTPTSTQSSAPIKHKRHSLGGVSSPLALSSLPPSNPLLRPHQQSQQESGGGCMKNIDKGSKEDNKIVKESVSFSLKGDVFYHENLAQNFSITSHEAKSHDLDTFNDRDSSLIDSTISRCKRDLSSDDSINFSLSNDASSGKPNSEKKFLSDPESKNLE